MLTGRRLKERDDAYILYTYARNDLVIVRGKGAVCWSAEGKRFIDFGSGIGVNTLGFSDDRWVQAISQQAGMLQHASNLYYTEPCGRVAEILLSRTGYRRMFFANSGAEANEGAIKTARKYSFEKYGEDRFEIITLKNSFHGRTMATATATGQDAFHRFFNPFLEGFVYAQANDPVDLAAKVTDRTCAILLEPVQGEGGVLPLTPAFFEAAAMLCREKDILLIADEVQTGIGRTGTLLACEQYDVRPDIVTVAKGLGGGLPIGGILFGEKCEMTLVPGDHGSTYGGNPVACAGAAQVLTRLDEAFLAQVREKAAFLKEELGTIAAVTDVGGLGLMLGFRVREKTAGEIVAACLERGLLVLTAKDRVRLLPPLVITREELMEGLQILRAVCES